MKTNEVTIYQNESFGKIRTTLDSKGKMWFCAKDICDILGYGNCTDALKKHVVRADLAKREVRYSHGGKLVNFVNESGLYSLIMDSKMPKARAFKYWVTSEVLPSIRATGTYTMPATCEQGIFTPTYLRQLADHIERLENTIEEEREERKRLEVAHAEEVKEIEMAHAQEIAQVKQEAQEAEEIVSGLRATGDCILVRELDTLLRQYGVNLGEHRLFSELVEDGFLVYKKVSQRGDARPRYLPTHKSKQLGLFKVTEQTISINGGEMVTFTSRVTGKGQVFLIKHFMKKYNINDREEG